MRKLHRNAFTVHLFTPVFFFMGCSNLEQNKTPKNQIKEQEEQEGAHNCGRPLSSVKLSGVT